MTSHPIIEVLLTVQVLFKSFLWSLLEVTVYAIAPVFHIHHVSLTVLQARYMMVPRYEVFFPSACSRLHGMSLAHFGLLLMVL